MTLSVNIPLGLGQSHEDNTHNAWDSADSAFAFMAVKGINFSAKPDFDPPIIQLNTYTIIEGAEYSTLMARTDRWFDYLRGLQAEIEGRLIPVRNEMDILAVDMRAAIRNQVEAQVIKKPSETEIKDTIKLSPRYRELLYLEQNLEISLKQVQYKVESLERTAKGLSRQVTIRGQDIEITGMNGGKRPQRM